MTIMTFKYDNVDQFDIARKGLEACGYSFLEILKAEGAHERSLRRYCETNDLIIVDANSNRLLFSSTMYRRREDICMDMTFLEPYTEEIRELLINNLTHEKDN